MEHMSSPGVTYQSSVPCYPHTPWFDGWMRFAFASILQTRPCPIFGRPVHLWDGSLRLQPGTSPHTLRIPSHDGHPVLQSIAAIGFRLLLSVSGFRLCARLNSPYLFTCLCPARHYSHFWILCPSSEHRRDFNPHD
jgi:hypothetical protein